MGLFSKPNLNKEIKRLAGTERKITLRCPKCGKVYKQSVYGDGQFIGRCTCGYTITDRDRY